MELKFINVSEFKSFLDFARPFSENVPVKAYPHSVGKFDTWNTEAGDTRKLRKPPIPFGTLTKEAGDAFRMLCTFSDKLAKLLDDAKVLESQSLIMDFAGELYNNALMPDVRSVPQEIDEPAVCADSETERRKNVLRAFFLKADYGDELFKKLSTCIDVLKIKDLDEATPADIDSLFIYYCDYYAPARRKEIIEVLRTDVIDVRRHKTALHFQNVLKWRVTPSVKDIEQAMSTLTSVRLDELYREFKTF